MALGPNPILIKTFIAGAAINPMRLLKMGAAMNEVIEAVDGAATIIGVSPDKSFALGDRVDVIMEGIAEVKAGGSFSRGGYVTAGTAGVAVASAPAGGANSNVAGFAMDDAVNNDVVCVKLGPHRLQG